jgi:hypothetical protein
MEEIVALVTSVDPLAPYKVSADLVLELVSATATIEDDPEVVAGSTCWVKIVQPRRLIKHQPDAGYILDNRKVQMTCSKSAEVRLGDQIKFRLVPATGSDAMSEHSGDLGVVLP